MFRRLFHSWSCRTGIKTSDLLLVFYAYLINEIIQQKTVLTMACPCGERYYTVHLGSGHWGTKEPILEAEDGNKHSEHAVAVMNDGFVIRYILVLCPDTIGIYRSTYWYMYEWKMSHPLLVSSVYLRPDIHYHYSFTLAVSGAWNSGASRSRCGKGGASYPLN